MGAKSAVEIDACLSAGGLVVTASDRAARATLAAFHRARRGEGRQAWTAPSIVDWQTFVRTAWSDVTRDDRLLLNPLQEQWLWAEILRQSGHSASLLEQPRRRLASMAMNAHALLCAYAPRYLAAKARAPWQQDAAAFSSWLSVFDDACRDQSLLSSHRLPLELIPLLQSQPTTRTPLLLVGFDRLLPAQHELFEAWGIWRHAEQGDPASTVHHFAAPDAQSELAACASWCHQRLASHPDHRLLVITQDAAAQRGEMERAFLRHADIPSFRFEFSLGIPLAEVALAQSAVMLLRWLDGSLNENEIDWLLSTGRAATSARETAALQSTMRGSRRQSLQRPQWTLQAFMSQRPAPPDAWTARMTAAQHTLAAAHPQRSPLEWSEFVSHLLETVGWPGADALSSAEFQAARRWNQLVETCGSLGFAAHRVSWHDFLSELRSAMDDTLFTPESEDAPILIAGPVESAGLTADAVWFLGADENAWPARGELHPLLPIEVQRDARMPHASPQLDWNLAQAVTTRLLAAAPETYFSYSRLLDGIDARASRLITQIASTPQPVPSDLRPAQDEDDLTVHFEDIAHIPFAGSAALRGGSTILTSQSHCPFKAFATSRLDAQDWEPAEAGLTAAERGKLLHAVLHSIWSGPPNGLRSLDDLAAVSDLRSYSAQHVHAIMQSETPPRARHQMPTRYLELEEARLTRLVSEWLEYERTRVSFAVAGTEIDTPVNIAGLALNLRLDRLDRLNDETYLVIDYKTGKVSPDLWELPRPDDVQLPLYAGFGLDQDRVLGGLVFARIRAGELCFTGRVGDAASTLFPGLNGRSPLVKNPLEAEQLIDWRDAIEQLARDYLAGRADVDPRDPPNTCKRCGLQTLCRIHERETVMEEDDPETEAVDD